MPAESLIDRYKQLFQKLLPPGVAMNRRDDSALADWLESFAVEFARVDEDALTAFVESYPGDATDAELLSDWETLVGLPNACTALLTTEAQRRTAVLAKFAAVEGQSKADFQSMATDLGAGVLDVSLYETSRCGVMRCGHTPLHSDPWLFGGRFAYENPGTDISNQVECNLTAHAHAHTQINWNKWDSGPVTSLPGTVHHFIHGEFTTTPHTDANGDAVEVITAWSNRETGNDWTQQGSDATTMHVLPLDGWDAAGSQDDVVRSLGGLYIRNTVVADTVLQHNDFSLFVAGYCTEFDNGTARAFMSGTGFALNQTYSAGSAKWQLIYDGANVTLPGCGLGRFIFYIGVYGTQVDLAAVDAAGNIIASTGTANDGALSDAILHLYSGNDTFNGGLFELASSSHAGIPGVDPEVDDVLEYLHGKYMS